MQVVWMLDCHLGKWAILKLGTQQLAAQESDIKATLDYKHCCLAHMRILLGIVPFFAILYLTFTLDGFIDNWSPALANFFPVFFIAKSKYQIGLVKKQRTL